MVQAARRLCRLPWCVDSSTAVAIDKVLCYFLALSCRSLSLITGTRCEQMDEGIHLVSRSCSRSRRWNLPMAELMECLKDDDDENDNHNYDHVIIAISTSHTTTVISTTAITLGVMTATEDDAQFPLQELKRRCTVINSAFRNWNKSTMCVCNTFWWMSLGIQIIKMILFIWTDHLPSKPN